MVKNESNDEPKFTMENNVYKGRQVPFTGRYKNLGEMLWYSMKNYENRIAQLDARTEKTVTFAELQRKAVKCAVWLQKQGVKHGDVISICTDNNVNAFVPCLAAIFINAIFNTWDENMNLRSMLYFLELTTPKVIFCSKKSADVILAGLKEKNYNAVVVIFGHFPNLISFSDILNNYNESEVENFRYKEIKNVKDTICILHSSGTTGMPKGIELSDYCILRGIGELSMESTVSLWFSTIFWISGVLLSLISIREGVKMIVYPQFDEEMACILIEKYEVSLLFSSTSMINRFLKSGFMKEYQLLSLKTILCGGTILRKETQMELRSILPHVSVLQGYGMTELCGAVIIQNSTHKNGSCGTVAANSQIKVVNREDGNALEPNQIGELYIKANTVMNGYYKNPVATKEIIDKEGWLHSGDLAYIDEDGEVFIVDRIKQLIKYRGYQIVPAEIELMLLRHPAVLEVGVVSVPHSIDDEHPIAYVARKPGFKVTEQELINFVANNMMDKDHLRAGVVFLDILPYTPSGKISKKDLKEMAKKLAKD